jgi:UDP-N-acetylglucosamine 2-epimerase (non-hydrolysing)
MIHAICVAGARPNLIKIKPVIDGLESLGAKTTFVHTDQHYDEAMSGVFLNDLGLRQPDRSLGVGSGTHAGQTARVMVAFEPVVDELRPDVVVVVGDVNSTLGCALVAAKAGAMVAHVEAGLHSRDWSMPEEANRVVTDRVSDDLPPVVLENAITPPPGTPKSNDRRDYRQPDARAPSIWPAVGLRLSRFPSPPQVGRPVVSLRSV